VAALSGRIPTSAPSRPFRQRLLERRRWTSSSGYIEVVPEIATVPCSAISLEAAGAAECEEHPLSASPAPKRTVATTPFVTTTPYDRSVRLASDSCRANGGYTELTVVAAPRRSVIARNQNRYAERVPPRLAAAEDRRPSHDSAKHACSPTPIRHGTYSTCRDTTGLGRPSGCAPRAPTGPIPNLLDPSKDQFQLG
jgi:hypothetical protein